MRICVFWTLLCWIGTALAVPDLYCGDRNCYEVLEVPRQASRQDVAKAYRKLAGKWHPDRYQDADDKSLAQQTFLQIATAYEVLKDNDSREEYNYMLDHPEEMWRNMYRYYRRRMAPKVDVRLVIVVSISLISAWQYYSFHSNYEAAIRYLVSQPKYRNQAAAIAKEEGLLKPDKKLDRSRSKADLRKEEERILRQIIENKMDIRGGHAKPKMTDILWVQLILLPYTVVSWIHFYVRWLWKFGILRQAYGRQEKLHIIRKHMNMSQSHFDSLTESEKDEYLQLNLWIKTEYLQWKQRQEDDMRIKMAQSGRFKQYRRFMRNHDNRLTFDD